MTELHSLRGLFTAEPYGPGGPLQVTVRAERIYIAGRPGSPWSITIRNLADVRLLVRAGVDGKNVLRDEPFSATSGGGYVLSPGFSYALQGWRTSDDDVREFVFTAAHESAGLPGKQGAIVLAAMAERYSKVRVSYADTGRDVRYANAVAAAAAPDLGTGAGEYRSDPVARTSFDPEPGDPDIMLIRYGSTAWLRLQQDDTGYGQYETATYSARALSRHRPAPRRPHRLRRLGRTGHPRDAPGAPGDIRGAPRLGPGLCSDYLLARQP